MFDETYTYIHVYISSRPVPDLSLKKNVRRYFTEIYMEKNNYSTYTFHVFYLFELEVTFVLSHNVQYYYIPKKPTCCDILRGAILVVLSNRCHITSPYGRLMVCGIYCDVTR